jgi:hypothetical protein
MGKIIKLYKVSANAGSKAFFKTSSYRKALAKARKHNLSPVGKPTDSWHFPYRVSVYGLHPEKGWGYFSDGMRRN